MPGGVRPRPAQSSQPTLSAQSSEADSRARCSGGTEQPFAVGHAGRNMAHFSSAKGGKQLFAAVKTNVRFEYRRMQ